MSDPFPKNQTQFRQIEWWAGLLLALIVCALILPTRMGNSFACPSAPNAIASHLRIIENAKQLWMAENKKPESDIPSAGELVPYFNQREMPKAVVGEIYQINALNQEPTAILTRPMETSKGTLPAGTIVHLDDL